MLGPVVAECHCLHGLSKSGRPNHHDEREKVGFLCLCTFHEPSTVYFGDELMGGSHFKNTASLVGHSEAP
jgi:hypothetical protein